MADEFDLVEKSRIMDSAAMNRALRRLATEIVEKNHGADGLYLVGIINHGNRRRYFSHGATIFFNPYARGFNLL